MSSPCAQFAHDMPTISQLPSGSYRAQVRVKGHKPQGSTFKTQAQAQAWGMRLEAQLTQKTAQTVLDGTATELTFEEAYKLYIASPVHAKKSDGTKQRELKAGVAPLRLLGPFALSNLDGQALQLHFFDIRGIEKNQRGQPISGDTVRLERSLISQVYGFAKKRGLAKDNPIIGVDFDTPSLKTRDVRISVENQAILQETAFYYMQSKRVNSNLNAWLSFVFDTGTRPGEAAKIRLEWLDLEKSQIRIPRSGHKTRQPRIILLPLNLQALLTLQEMRARAAGSPYLFWSESKKGFVPYAYYHPWRAICKLCGLPAEVVPHAVRHEFISRLFESPAGLSDSQIALLVGDVHPLSLTPYKHLQANAFKGTIQSHADKFEQAGIEAYNNLTKLHGNKNGEN